MINIAVLGFGVVGSGTASLINDNAELIKNRVGDDVCVKRILDLRDFPESPFADKITHNYEDIVNDKDISIVCELIGGLHPAYEFTVAAFKAGKSVVTSNKEIVATYGDELLDIAKENGVYYFFEAAVGGGIPVLRPLCEDVSTVNKIERVDGILNGTTNYILTKMKNEGTSFADALASAQKNGYAEADPSADIEGKDTCRKICILGALAFGKLLDVSKISTKGITALTISDIENAERMGYSVKLIGSAFKNENGDIAELVRPCFVPAEKPLSSVNDVFNGVSICGNYVGELMFYGRGAGSEPTASAVASDVIRIASGASVRQMPWERVDGDKCVDVNKLNSTYYICAKTTDAELVKNTLGELAKIIPTNTEICAILKNPISLCELEAKISKAPFGVGSVIEVL